MLRSWGRGGLLDCGTGNEAHYEDYFELMRQASPHAAAVQVEITMKPHGGISLTIADLREGLQQRESPRLWLSAMTRATLFTTPKESSVPKPDAEKVGAQVSTVIIKDCAVEDGNPDVMVTPGEGLVDFEKVLGGLVAGGFDGPLYVECVGGKTVDEINANVKSTLKFVSDILA